MPKGLKAERVRVGVYEKPKGSGRWWIRYAGLPDEEVGDKFEALAKVGSMRKDNTFGFRWRLLDVFKEIASRPQFQRDPSDLARQVLEEFCSCYMTDEELDKAGMAEYVALRRNGLIDMALMKAKQNVRTSAPNIRTSS